MELIDYLNIIGRRSMVIILTVFFTVAVVTIGVVGMPTKYTANAQIRVLTTVTGGTDYRDYNLEYTTRLMGTYVKVATSAPILEQLSRSIDPLPKIEAKIIPDTELIQITAEDTDPAVAQFAANKLAQILVDESRQLAVTGETNTAKVYVVEPASLPKIPSSPSPFLLIGLALVIGLIGGLGLAFIFENLDTRLYNVKQMQNVTNLPLLGDIPEDRSGEMQNGLFVDSRVHIEALRRLRTNIFSPAQNYMLKKLLITSAVIQDGRSTITANLGLSIALTRRKVILVDANLRYPSLHEFFSLDNDCGLSNILENEIELSQAIKPTKYANLFLLPSGPKPANPVELLGQPMMENIINDLAAQFDIVLIDSPSSISVTDPAVLATLVDGVVLVVREGWVRTESLQATLRHLESVKANMVGIIANRTGLGAKSKFSLVPVQLRPKSQTNGKNGTPPPEPKPLLNTNGEGAGGQEKL